MASFLRKGKPFCWKQANKDPEFLDIFSRLGMEMHVPAEVFSAMETFVCFLYGEKKIEHVNEARSAIFWRKMNKEHKAVDLSYRRVAAVYGSTLPERTMWPDFGEWQNIHLWH